MPAGLNIPQAVIPYKPRGGAAITNLAVGCTLVVDIYDTVLRGR